MLLPSNIDRKLDQFTLSVLSPAGIALRSLSRWWWANSASLAANSRILFLCSLLNKNIKNATPRSNAKTGPTTARTKYGTLYATDSVMERKKCIRLQMLKHACLVIIMGVACMLYLAMSEDLRIYSKCKSNVL